MLDKRNEPKRWPRGQKFTLSTEGADAEAAYRNVVAESRSSGRAALDAALAAWAGPRRVAPVDGVVLAELRGKRLGVPDLVRELESAGIAADEVRASLERLVQAGVVAPIPLASQLGN